MREPISSRTWVCHQVYRGVPLMPISVGVGRPLVACCCAMLRCTGHRSSCETLRGWHWLGVMGSTSGGWTGGEKRHEVSACGVYRVGMRFFSCSYVALLMPHALGKLKLLCAKGTRRQKGGARSPSVPGPRIRQTSIGWTARRGVSVQSCFPPSSPFLS